MSPAACGCCRRASAWCSRGWFRAARGVRRALALAARGRRVPRHRARRRRRRRVRRSTGSPTGRARWCSPAPSTSAPTERALLAGFLLGDTRGVPDDARRAVPRRRASRTSSRCRARTSRSCSRSSAPLLRRLGAARPGRRRRSPCSCVRHDDPVGAVGAARRSRWPSSRSWPGSSGGRPSGSGARARRDRAAARRSVPAALGRASCCRARRASASRVLGPPDHRAGCPGPRWLREALGVTAAAQIGVAPVLIPVFGSMPLVALPANLLAAPLAGAAHDLGSRGRRRRRPGPAPVSPAIAAAAAAPDRRSAATRSIAVADRRVPAVPVAGRRARGRVGLVAARRPPGARHTGARRLRAERCREWRYRLGDEVHDLTTRTLVMGILNRTPDSFYDHGATFELDALLPPGRGARRPGRRPPRRRRREGRARARGRRGRGARPGRSPRSRRCTQRFDVADLVRHLAGHRCSTRRARPARSSATTSAASATPTTSPSPPRTARRWSPPTSACSPRVPDPEPALRRPRRRRHRVPPRPRRAGRGRRARRPSRSRSTPASTSARHRRRARCCCARATRSPTLGYTLLLSASNKRFLGDLLEPRHRRPARGVAGHRRVRRRARLPDRAGPRRRRVGRGLPHDRSAARAHDDVAARRAYLVKGSRPVVARPGASTTSSPSCSAATTAASRSRRSPSPAAPAPATIPTAARRRRGSRRRGCRAAERGGEPAVHDRAPRRRGRATSASSPPATSTASSATSPIRSTRPILVFVAGGGTMPPALTKKLKESRPRSAAPESEKTDKVLLAARARGRRARCAPTRRARSRRTSATTPAGSPRIVDVLASAYGPDVRLGVDDVAPYLGEAGAVPSYQLTNAIEDGDPAAALEMLHRLLTASSPQQPKPMHPLQIMGTAATATTGASCASTTRRCARRRRGRRARREGEGVPGAQGARPGAGARHRRDPAGVRRAVPGRPRPQGRARHPRAGGDGGARRAARPAGGAHRRSSPSGTETTGTGGAATMSVHVRRRPDGAARRPASRADRRSGSGPCSAVAPSSTQRRRSSCGSRSASCRRYHGAGRATSPARLVAAAAGCGRAADPAYAAMGAPLGDADGLRPEHPVLGAAPPMARP